MGKGKFVPILYFISERCLAVGIECWAPVFVSPLLAHGLDQSQQPWESSEWD